MFNTNLKRGGGYKPSRQFPLTAAVVALLLFIAAIVFSGCAGGAGGSGADDVEDGAGTIALSLAPVTSSRSARAAGEWSTATGTFSVSIKSDSYLYSDSKSIELSPGSPRSVTFKAVPVGITATISATFTGTFEDVPESKTYTDRVTKTITSGTNVIALHPTEVAAPAVLETLPEPVVTITPDGTNCILNSGTSYYAGSSGTFRFEASGSGDGVEYSWTVQGSTVRTYTGATVTDVSVSSGMGITLSATASSVTITCTASKEGFEDAETVKTISVGRPSGTVTVTNDNYAMMATMLSGNVTINSASGFDWYAALREKLEANSDVTGYSIDMRGSGRTYLAQNEFAGASKMTSLTINREVTEIYRAQFYGCSPSITMEDTSSTWRILEFRSDNNTYPVEGKEAVPASQIGADMISATYNSSYEFHKNQ